MSISTATSTPLLCLVAEKSQETGRTFCFLNFAFSNPNRLWIRFQCSFCCDVSFIQPNEFIQISRVSFFAAMALLWVLISAFFFV